MVPEFKLSQDMGTGEVMCVKIIIPGQPDVTMASPNLSISPTKLGTTHVHDLKSLVVLMTRLGLLGEFGAATIPFMEG